MKRENGIKLETVRICGRIESIEALRVVNTFSMSALSRFAMSAAVAAGLASDEVLKVKNTAIKETTRLNNMVACKRD